jgi:hypothetical protein
VNAIERPSGDQAGWNPSATTAVRPEPSAAIVCIPFSVANAIRAGSANEAGCSAAGSCAEAVTPASSEPAATSAAIVRLRRPRPTCGRLLRGWRVRASA